MYLCKCFQGCLTEEGRPTLDMGGIPWHPWLNKKDKQTETQPSSLCFLSVDNTTNEITYTPNPHGGQYPQTVIQNKLISSFFSCFQHMTEG